MLKHASAISQDMLVLFDLDRIQKGFSIHALLKEFLPMIKRAVAAQL